MLHSGKAIAHCGDERSGDKKGDDETVLLKLDAMHPAVAYLGIIINSYSGQELDDVHAAFCHLYDPSNGVDVVRFTMTDCNALDGFTALILGVLYREPASNEWCLRIVGQPAQGLWRRRTWMSCKHIS